MLRRLALRDVVIVAHLEIELGAGLTVLTGETGAGKSILIDALQLALGARADAGVVREGAARAEVTAEFDRPAGLAAWLDEGGFAGDDGTLLLRRTVDAQGRSRAWINGSPATVTQLRDVAEALVQIHGQHAWQSLSRPAAARLLLDAAAGVDAPALESAWRARGEAARRLADARERQGALAQERERLQWQLQELERLDPGTDEWPQLDAEHRRLSQGESLLAAVAQALDALSEGDASADALAGRAASVLQTAAADDPQLGEIARAVRDGLSALADAAHSLSSYRDHVDLSPQRLAELDARMSTWMQLARRWRRPPEDLPALRVQWQRELQQLEAAADLDGLQQAADASDAAWRTLATAADRRRRAAAPTLIDAVTAQLQQLGMQGGRLDIAFAPAAQPQAHGLETSELLIAGHAGSTPRPLAKVASGGELSRTALAIAVVDAQAEGPAGTLIFDEIDTGIGGAVADVVGRLMRALGEHRQVLAVTHLPQVAACAHHHLVVAKAADGERTVSRVEAVDGAERVAEIARMLGGTASARTSLAHAKAMLQQALTPRP